MSLASTLAKTTTDILKSKKFLAGVVVVGVGLVATTAATGTVIAKKHIDEAKDNKETEYELNDIDEPAELTKIEVVKACWKDYLPCAAAVGLTVTAFFRLYSRFSKENAALHGLLSVSEATVEHLQQKMISEIGEKKALPIINETKQEVMDEVKPKEAKQKVLYLDSHGDELINFCDPWSKRTFRATKVQVCKAIEQVNLNLHDDGRALLNDFYEWLGLEDSEAGDLVGWEIDTLNSYKLDIVWDGVGAGAYTDNEGKSWTYLTFNQSPTLINTDW